MEDPARLREVTELALALMLRRPADHDLKAELIHQVHDVIAGVRPEHSPDTIRNEMRSAARGCVKILQVAKERRLPRRLQPGGEAHGGTDAGHHSAAKPHPPSKPAGSGRTAATWGVAGIALAALAFGGYAWWNSPPSTGGDAAEAAAFTRQVIEAAKGEAPATHAFGGSLKAISLGGRPVVVADGVPPRICVASGWALVKAGVLSINGITPNRISAGKITELCNSEDGNASIMWTPK